MEISFILWGQLRDAAGESNITIEIDDGANLKDAVSKLAETNESLSHVLIDGNGQLRESNIAFINGTQMSWQDETALPEKAEITMMSPIAGG